MSRTFQPHIVTDDSALGGTIINGSLYKQSDQYLEKVLVQLVIEPNIQKVYG